LAPLVYASVNTALSEISPFLYYCQLELLNCGKSMMATGNCRDYDVI